MNIPAGGHEPREHDPRTRARVLAAITEHGPVTASTIGSQLGLTPAAVRRHLDALAEQGAIAPRDDLGPTGSRRRGRPARRWVAADAGHAALPADYDDLATHALRYLRDTVGEHAVEAFARERFAATESRYAAAVAGAGSEPDARTDALVAALSRDGYAASARPVGDGGHAGVQLCQGHCPVQQVAAEFPQLCQAETDSFSRLLGVHVQRLSTLARGQHVCTTFVPTPATRHTGSSSSPSRKGGPA